MTDRKGSVVTGLPRSAFQITELDQPQNILNFEEAGAHAVPAGAAIHSTARNSTPWRRRPRSTSSCWTSSTRALKTWRLPDVDMEIADGIRDGGSFYTVSYRPTTSTTDPKKLRRIRVTLDDPNLKATTRGRLLRAVAARPRESAEPVPRLAFEVLSADRSNMVYDGAPRSLSADPASPDAFNIMWTVKAWSGLRPPIPTHAAPR